MHNQFRVRVGVPVDRCDDLEVVQLLEQAAGRQPSGKEDHVEVFGAVDFLFEFATREEAVAAEERLNNTHHICFSEIERRKD